VLTSKYSICITQYNNASTVRQSLESILNQIDDRFEVVVVDSLSTDGSKEILKEFADAGKIKLIAKKCSRGLGRQIAFENSTGSYIIANLDMDDIFGPKLNDLIVFYHKKCEGKLLRVAKTYDTNQWEQNVTIAPRALLSEIGGWPDLQLFEDWYVWASAAKLNKYSWTVSPLAINETTHPERNTSGGKFKFRYLRYRELMRLGRSISFAKGEKVNMAQRLAKLLALISQHFYKSYKNKVDLNFTSFESSFYIQ
jgi:glycosyltransferase involved in cell wall biosynthesis